MIAKYIINLFESDPGNFFVHGGQFSLIKDSQTQLTGELNFISCKSFFFFFNLKLVILKNWKWKI